MNTWMKMLPLCIGLAGCGAGETVTAAAVGAKMKSDEIQQGKQLEEQTKARVEQALSAGAANLQAADQKAGGEGN
jgi:hypothetical protein